MRANDTFSDSEMSLSSSQLVGDSDLSILINIFLNFLPQPGLFGRSGSSPVRLQNLNSPLTDRFESFVSVL